MMRLASKKLEKDARVRYMIPHFIGFLILFVIPFGIGLYYSFQSSMFSGHFVGVANYSKIMNNVAFQLAFKNNVTFMLIAIPSIVAIGFILAYGIYEVEAPEFVKFAFIIPIAIPSATVIGFFRKLFSTGQLDLLNSDYAMLAVLFIFIWKNIGYVIIILSAGLNAIPKVYIENAEMDGSNFLQKIWHVIIPMLTPSFIFATIVSFINSYKVFKEIYLLQGKYPNQSIYMIQNYMNNKVSSFKFIDLIVSSYLFTAFIAILIVGFILVDRYYMKRMGEV